MPLMMPAFSIRYELPKMPPDAAATLSLLTRRLLPFSRLIADTPLIFSSDVLAMPPPPCHAAAISLQICRFFDADFLMPAPCRRVVFCAFDAMLRHGAAADFHYFSPLLSRLPLLSLMPPMPPLFSMRQLISLFFAIFAPSSLILFISAIISP